MAGNLADPDFEPSDEELQQLARDAFADVPARNREAQQRLWDEIAALRAQVLARLAAHESTKP
jgi:predicted Zn-dependent protease with MMP-like domain